jgi:hypothetical protein
MSDRLEDLMAPYRALLDQIEWPRTSERWPTAPDRLLAEQEAAFSSILNFRKKTGEDRIRRIADCWPIAGSTLSDVAYEDADFHANGSVVSFRANGSKYIAKIACQYTYHIVNMFLKELINFDFKFTTIESGFEDFPIVVRPWIMWSEGGIASDLYSYSLGVVMGMYYCLNGTDLHFENIVCSDSGIIPIDVESLASFYVSRFSMFDLQHIGLIDHRNNGRLSIEIDNFDYWVTPYLFERKLHIRQKKKYFQHINAKFDGRPIHEFVDYKCLRTGIMSSFNLLEKRWPEINEIFVNSGLKSRVYVRPTSFYKILLNELLLCRAPQWKKLIALRLHDAGTSAGHYGFQSANAETSSLLNYSIPIFHTDIRTGSLFHDYVITKQTSQQPPLSLFMHKKKNLTKDHMERVARRVEKVFLVDKPSDS